MDWELDPYCHAFVIGMNPDTGKTDFRYYCVIPEPPINLGIMDPRRWGIPEFLEPIEDLGLFPNASFYPIGE